MLPCSRGCHGSQGSLCYCIYLLIRLLASRPCVRLRGLSVACPGSACWHHHSADVRRSGVCKVLFVSMYQMLAVFHSNNECHVFCLVVKLKVHLRVRCMCFQRMGACHTVNHRSPPPVDTAPLAQPPPRARQGHVRPRVHDSRSSGPPQSMLNSWGPMDRDSTRGSYVSNSVFCCFAAVFYEIWNSIYN